MKNDKFGPYTYHLLKPHTASVLSGNINLWKSMCGIISLVLLFSVIFVSCRKEKEVFYTQIQKDQIEKELKALKQISEHKAKIHQYEQSGNKLGVMIGYRFLGQDYRDSSRFDEALMAHRKEYDIAKEQNDTIEMVSALNNIGTNFRRIGELDEASTYHYRALSLSNQYSDKTSYMAVKARVISLNGVGNVHLTLGNVEVADSVFRLSLEGEKQLGSKIGQAINYANLGSVMESQNLTDSARIYFKKSLKLNREGGSNLGVALCQISLGQLEEKAKAWDKAIQRYMQAYHILKETGDHWHWMSAAFCIIDFYISRGDYVTAEQYITEAKPIAERLGSLEYLTNLYHEEYHINEQRGDYRQALDCYAKSQMYKDSLMGEAKMRRIQSIRVEYERKNKEREMYAMKHEIKQGKKLGLVFLISGICIFVLSTIIIASLWYIIRIRSKNHKMRVHIEQIKDNFYINLTHEFRTPLTIILGFSKQMIDGTLIEQSELKKAGEIIRRQGCGLLDLINQLLEIAKIKSGVTKPEYRHGDIVTYIRMIIESHQALARNKLIELTFMPKQTHQMMDFVPDYIIKIVRNLVSNAIKYTPLHGRVKLTAEVRGETFILKVIDNGQGILPEDLPYIFSPLYQSKVLSNEVGTGIGLALVKQLVETMKGSATVDSEVGKGSTFTVKLPLRVEKSETPIRTLDQDEEIMPNIEPTPAVTHTDVSSRSISVLIVEDNVDVAQYIGMQLKHEYNLLFAHDGVEGLAKAKDLMPDIILTDWMMPLKDGLEFCREIRSSDVLSHIPVIIITARCTDADKLKGLEAGADAYLIKPFSADELKVRIKNLIRQKEIMRQKYALSSKNDVKNMPDLSAVDQAFLHKFIDLVYAHMANYTTDTESIASDLCMTSKQLRAKIFSITGENTSAYIQKIRMEKSKRLLKDETNMDIATIAMKCGFEDVSYFSRVFKKMYSITPSQYRRQPS
ncbi:MAG: ATP-binding protein [Prevotella sp.]|jgi:two-component system sensor histidine kinase ChiS